MTNWTRVRAVVIVLGVTLLAGCGQDVTPEARSGSLKVTVSILPQQYFVERIGGEHVSVNVMVEPGDSPHTYEPKPEQLRALSEAAIYFRIGVDFENAWMDRISAANPDMMMVDTTVGIERAPMVTHQHLGGEQGGTGETENPDPHIWTSPRLVKIQASTVFEALSRVDPAHADGYKTNLDHFLTEIDALDVEIRRALARTERRKIIVFHPAWGYFAREYGLEMIPVEIGGQEPSPAELADLVTMAKEEGINVVFAQPELSTRDAETIANEIDGEVLLISPLAPDWLENLRRVAGAFAGVLGTGERPHTVMAPSSA